MKAQTRFKAVGSIAKLSTVFTNTGSSDQENVEEKSGENDENLKPLEANA